MTNSKSIKRALILSILLIVVCVSMLIGTTFAWFTDTAETSVNTIQAGTLDVALEMKEGENWVSAEGETLSFKAEGGQILWQPGCTYSLPELRVVNKGNLALKYKIIIIGIQGDAKLYEVIDWTINGQDINKEYELAVGAKSKSLTISGTMKTTAGNQYQGLSIDGISITVVATQTNKKTEYASEEYAWGNLNDIHTDAIIDGKGYLYVKDYQELKLAENANITIKNLTFNNGLTLYTESNVTGTITLENCTIYLHDDTDQKVFGMDFADYGLYIGAVSENVTWIFKNCTFKAHDNHEYTNTTNSYNVYIAGNYNAKSITFEGCEFSGSGKHGIGCSSDGSSTYYDFTVTNCSFLNWNNNNKFTNGAAIRGNVTSTALNNITIKIENNTFGINNGSTQKTVAIDGWNGKWN